MGQSSEARHPVGVVDIDKTGANSASYMEFKFEKDNKLTAWWWVQDDNNLSHWTEGAGTYLVKGTIVTITDINGDTMDLLFNSKDRTLMFRIATVVNGIAVTTNIYFRK